MVIPKLLRAKIGQTVQFHCRKDLKYSSWTLKGYPLPANSINWVRTDETHEYHVLRLSGVDEFNEGKYICSSYDEAVLVDSGK